MRPPSRQRLRLSGGNELSFITSGEASNPAVLLLHGSPSSATMFRAVIPELAQVAHVIAPDLPGFGESDVLRAPSFPALGDAISELLERLSIGPRYIYLHDYGAPVGLHIAMQAPERVLGLIVQNGTLIELAWVRNGMRRRPPTGRVRPLKTRRPRRPTSPSKARALHIPKALRQIWSRACRRKSGRRTGG